MREQKRSGFSRWELLALGAVVITAGVALMPVVAQTVDEIRAKENANASRCANNLKQVSLGLMQYEQDYDEKMPQATLGASANIAYGWADAVYPYIKNTALFQCPSEKHERQNDPKKPGYTDYWLNRNMSGAQMEAMHTPAELLMLGDGDGGAPNSNARYNLNALPKSWISTANSPARRHEDSAIYAFADGHVKRMAPSEVGTRKASFSLK